MDSDHTSTFLLFADTSRDIFQDVFDREWGDRDEKDLSRVPFRVEVDIACRWCDIP